MMNPVGSFVKLLRSFLGRTITAKEFETAFFSLFKSRDRPQLPEQQFLILDELFYYVDAFNDNPEIFDARQDIDEEELRRCAQVALDKLVELGDE